MGLFNRFKRSNEQKIKRPDAHTIQEEQIQQDVATEAKPQQKTVNEVETSTFSTPVEVEAEAESKTNTDIQTPESLAPASTETSIKDHKEKNIAVETPNNDKRGLFARLKEGLKKTRSKLGGGIGDLLLGKKVIDDDLIDDIEMQLLTADIGVEATQEIMETVRNKVSRNELQTIEALTDLIKEKLKEIITPSEKPLVIDSAHKPYVILMIGINGAGKTTTIGKLAKKFQTEGKSVILAAGDTFRAAAVEQLQVWGERNHIPVIAQHTGADSASVIYDAVQAAKSRNIDIVIADTAGRLHNKDNLMEELKKVARVMKKLDDKAPHEVMLVLDSGTGQNAIMQAEVFNKILSVTGITLTKMDGTAKGGVIFAIAKKLQLPIRFIGIGEKIDDLRPFHADDFIDALFSQD
ncbi:signal recognition particle-docking protein FtsY [Cysteiniphilum sp. QT6929]|uniref:signal recognition particle-docking protein FtsY n=1 Tax=Cysteiniphilum sp. QT6929 TaxID=2975055 RepID=UPI0024B35CBB|nr:signal recognition particle-docking protein FtsY [Cysteiniphilum sp. QT6929]WHN66562.1 signal recognition particle-docking protein FtsY [Cysteiniphilum sp. QT6929]